MPLFSSIASSIRKSFQDVFSSRANTTGDLGIATDGSHWNAINGVIQVTTGEAVATTTPASNAAGNLYPMAVQDMPTENNVASLVTSTAAANQGAGIAFWVQSSDDWWLADATASRTSSTNYTSTTSTTPNAWSSFSGGGVYTTTVIAWNSTTNWTSSSSTSFSQFLRIKRSTNSVVSQISSQTVSTSQTINSLRVITNGNIITASAYNDSAFVTQLGSNLVYTATGATVGTQYGISLSPSTYNQTTSIGSSITIARN